MPMYTRPFGLTSLTTYLSLRSGDNSYFFFSNTKIISLGRVWVRFGFQDSVRVRVGDTAMIIGYC